MGLSSTCSCTLFSMHSTGQPLHEPCCVEVYLHINMQFDCFVLPGAGGSNPGFPDAGCQRHW